MSGTKVMWGQLALVGLIVLATTWAATEWTTETMGRIIPAGRPIPVEA